MKRAFFIIGPESSGTKMLTEAFVSVGCYGNKGHRQSLDHVDIGDVGDEIVWRRSMPHGRGWPTFDDIFGKVREYGYVIYPILIFRDKDYTVRSQMKHGHVGSSGEGRLHIYRAIESIYVNLAKQGMVPYVISYEAFVGNEEVRRVFFGQFGFPLPGIKFYNANNKYGYEECKKSLLL